MGLQAYQQIKQEEPVSRDAALNERVQTVGRRIAKVSGQPDWDWQFTLFENPEPNAFALPGGKVGVNTGLFKVAKNDAQLAAVMGHEVGHAIARHGAERMSQGILAQLGGVAIGAATGSQAYVDLYSQGSHARRDPALLAHPGERGRRDRPDADGRGRLRPTRGDRAVRNFEALGGERLPEFLSTHPAEGTRIERLEELMPQALRGV